MHKHLLPLLLCLVLSVGRADIVINEVVHAPSERVLKWDGNGVPTLGTGPAWYTAAFDASAAKGWQTANGPFGFGTLAGAPTLGLNTQTQMQYLTPTLYLRKSFTVSPADAARTDPLEFVVQYNDGFILYLNGKEVARRWAGPPNQFHYHDQPAYDQEADLNSTATDSLRYAETINLGNASTLLTSGTNVLAVHALNLSSVNGNFLYGGTLRIGGGSPTQLIGEAEQHQYFIGVVEPSGGLYDPALLSSGRLNVPWARTTYNDTGWSSGLGPIGQGIGGLGTTTGGIVGNTPSLYTRVVFNATEAQATSATALQLLVDYDDAFVAYINGVEVARANLQTPNTFTPRTAVATGTRDYSSQATFNLEAASKLLRTGSNVLAIQVHNVSIGNTDIAVKADLKLGAATLVPYQTTWKYLVGTREPVEDTDGAIEDSPDLPESVADWVELHNNGATDVSLAGWSLTDTSDDPAQWVFPAGTMIPAGGYLVVVCDGTNITTPASGGYFHTNFKLDADGEFLGLYNAAGIAVQTFSPKLSAGLPHYSLIRNGSAQYVYSDLATPGAANTGGNTFTGIVAAPTANVPAGYYGISGFPNPNVILSTTTPGATIRYTVDGSEPTLTTGTAYAGGNIPIGTSTSLRARAFLAGSIPSATTTRNYIIRDGNTVKDMHLTLPSVSLTGPETRSLYRPFGVMAIKEANIGAGQNFTAEGNPWTALSDPNQYNNPSLRGRFMERPVNWEMVYPGNTTSFNLDIGLRMAGSPYTRPRYTIPDQNRISAPNSGPWPNNALRKPSMNFYMRNDLGGDPLKFPVIPNSPVTRHSDFRFRSGHNDLNPFIIDELMRRLYSDTGQLGSLGANVNLFVNGVYKGLYNLCQHVREEWCQEAFGSDLKWDVIQVGVASDGDLIALQEMITFLRTYPQSNPGSYQAMQTRMNMVNFIDYLLVNIYGATGDWPGNNWICARERSTNGKFHFFVWDAEGAFGSFGLTVRSNNFTTAPGSSGNQSALITTTPLTDALSTTPRILYTLLADSPEFRLLFADRIQKHFFNSGALTDLAVKARNDALANQCKDFISGYNSTRILNWINGVGTQTRYNGTSNIPSRRQVLLNGYFDDTNSGVFVPAVFTSAGVWPATLAPTLSQHGGSVGNGIQLAMANPNAPNGTIYYTVNGIDPRGSSGNIVGTQYTAGSPITVNTTLTVKARVRNSNGEWSPLCEANFTSATAPSLVITEIMYNPPDFNGVNGAEFEFLELKNVGSTPIELFGMHFSEGIDFTFPAGASLGAGELLVLAKNPTQFAQRYGVTAFGSYGPSSSLNNAGETITLVSATGAVIFSVTYDDNPPWPIAADGSGYSLVPVLPNSNPNPNDAINWRASTQLNGSPGVDDAPSGVVRVRINEVLANSVNPAVDAVELFNPEAVPANIGGWYLSDNLGNPKKYRIPDNTTVPAGGYLILDETAFNTGPNAFAFSQNGEEAVLSSADAAGTLTGYTEMMKFDATEPGVTVGAYTNSAGKKFVTSLAAATLGGPNTGPKVGPVILTELNYYPVGSAAEFIEIQNNSNAPVPLYDPANPQNTWRIKGVGFSFPPGVIIQPREFILISANNPTSFRASYSIPASITIYGPYNPEDLNNAGERVALQKPGQPYLDNSSATVIPYIDIDAVEYSSTWYSTTANGNRTLERAYVNRFGDDKTSWKASGIGGNPGRYGPISFETWQAQWFSLQDYNTLGAANADPDGDGIVNLMEYAFGTLPTSGDAVGIVTSGLAMDGGNGPYLTLTLRRSQAIQAATFNVNVDLAGSLPDWGTGAVQVGSAVKNNDGTETVVFRDTVPFSSTNSRFMRVRGNYTP